KAFLQFVSKNRPSDDFTDGLLKSVAEVKRNEFFRKEYLSMGVWETDIREQGMQEGMERGIQQGAQEKAVDTALNFLQKTQLSPEVIAECCSLPLERVLELQKEIMAKA
ncbi:MAG: hypothetical protein IKP60_09815, partial [Treponema sp.]|nr:hypothetical protein [Treponema sp.]